MKFKILILLMSSFLLSSKLSAHEGGHGYPSKVWSVDSKSIAAEFIKYENGKVYLLDSKHQLNAYDFTSFSDENQDWISEVTKKVSTINKSVAPQLTTGNYNLSTWGYILGGGLLLLGFFFYSSKKKVFHRTSIVLGCLVITFVACNKDNNSDLSSISVVANDVNFLTALFEQFSGVNIDSDSEWVYISSNGLPAHNMMVGITNWQQQVPIDQNYTGNNSWAIPIQPKLLENPLSTQTNLLKGAIAIAVNGIPIFNPLNNRGEDANDIGELDQWGGHCGRADDYHYHLPPIHLESVVGTGNPIAYAVDGFPVYGETTEELDEYLGRFTTDSSYQYHTIQDYPYFIAGMRGQVTLDPSTSAPENQVIPQAMTQELRPATSPLQGAVITHFVMNNPSSYSLTYTFNGENYIINYSWDTNGLYTYEFVNPDGSNRIETYQR